MGISLIVAMDRNGLIGNETGLPWRLPADLRRFRKLTTGHPIIMGRKTFEHIGGALKDRLNIILSRRTDWQSVPQGCVVAHTLDQALQLARDAAPPIRNDEIFIIGGADIYRQALPIANRVYMTIVEGHFSGNTWFPFDESFRGTVTHDEKAAADEKNPHPHRFVIVERTNRGITFRDLLVD